MPLDQAEPDAVEPRPEKSPRWAQLTYSSFDRRSGTPAGSTPAGGWQIKQISGGLSPAEQDSLRSRISTRLDPTLPIPAFPTREEIDALPRRLVYRPLDGGAAGYWHTVPAGTDGTGRPGNVFAHIVFDRRIADQQPPIRPIETWRSADWLTPFGPQEVLAAELGSAPYPRPGPIGRAAVLDFLFDTGHWRLGVLGPLLDAVANALDGGPRVVLVVGSPDTGILWIAALSHLMSAGTSRRCGFSTIEHLRPGEDETAQWPLFSVVTRAGLAAGTQLPGLVHIDEDEIVEIGELGGDSHVTLAGSRIPVTPWSMMATVVLTDRTVALAVLADMDHVAAEVGDQSLWVSWPLAMSLTHFPELLAEVELVAAAVITEHSPMNLADHAAEYRSAVDVVTKTLADGPDALWLQLVQLEEINDRVMVDIVSRVYVEQALHDRDWIRCHPDVPVPKAFERGAPAGSELSLLARELLDALIWPSTGTKPPIAQQSPDDRIDNAVYAVRLVDFLARLGLLNEDTTDGEVAVDRAHVALEQVVVPVLYDELGATEFLDRVGRRPGRGAGRYLITEVTLRINQGDRPLGDRLKPELVMWLVADTPTPPDLPALVAANQEVDALTAEVAMQISLGRIRVAQSIRAAWCPAAVWCALAELATPADRLLATDEVLTSTAALHAWRTADVVALEQVYRHAVPMVAVLSVVWFAPWTPDIETLARRWGDRNQEAATRLRLSDVCLDIDDDASVEADAAVVRNAATLRGLVHRRAWGEPLTLTSARHMVQLARELSITVQPPRLPADTYATTLAAAWLLVLAAQPHDDPVVVRRLLPTVRAQVTAADVAQVSTLLDSCLDAAVITEATLWEACLRCHPEAPFPWPVNALQWELQLVVTDQGYPLLESLIRSRLVRKAVSDEESVLAEVNAELAQEIAGRAFAGQDIKADIADSQRFVKSWLRRMRGGPTPALFGRTRLRRG